MSTRCTMAYTTAKGVTYHLFTDCLEPQGTVYLETWMRGRGAIVEMAVPPDVWEFLRSFQADAFRGRFTVGDWAAAKADVVGDVDARIQAGRCHPHSIGCISGEGVYGPWTDPRETQIARGLAEARRARAKVARLRKNVQRMLAEGDVR